MITLCPVNCRWPSVHCGQSNYATPCPHLGGRVACQPVLWYTKLTNDKIVGLQSCALENTRMICLQEICNSRSKSGSEMLKISWKSCRASLQSLSFQFPFGLLVVFGGINPVLKKNNQISAAERRCYTRRLTWSWLTMLIHGRTWMNSSEYREFRAATPWI